MVDRSEEPATLGLTVLERSFPQTYTPCHRRGPVCVPLSGSDVALVEVGVPEKLLREAEGRKAAGCSVQRRSCS